MTNDTISLEVKTHTDLHSLYTSTIAILTPATIALLTGGGLAQRSCANNFVGDPRWKVTGSILAIEL